MLGNRTPRAKRASDTLTLRPTSSAHPQARRQTLTCARAQTSGGDELRTTGPHTSSATRDCANPTAREVGLSPELQLAPSVGFTLSILITGR